MVELAYGVLFFTRPLLNCISMCMIPDGIERGGDALAGAMSVALADI
jgi:hypothetical protein